MVFHSNDVRGVFLPRRAVLPLARAVGEEVGVAGTRLPDSCDLSAAARWRLDLASETVWNGDDGTTEVSGAYLRLRASSSRVATKWTPGPAADLQLSLSDHSRFSTDH